VSFGASSACSARGDRARWRRGDDNRSGGRSARGSCYKSRDALATLDGCDMLRGLPRGWRVGVRWSQRKRPGARGDAISVDRTSVAILVGGCGCR
jgi:hypothetical protein